VTRRACWPCAADAKAEDPGRFIFDGYRGHKPDAMVECGGRWCGNSWGDTYRCDYHPATREVTLQSMNGTKVWLIGVDVPGYIAEALQGVCRTKEPKVLKRVFGLLTHYGAEDLPTQDDIDPEIKLV